MQRQIERRCVTVALSAGLALAACGDDANDAALREQREANRSAIVPSTSTSTVLAPTTSATTTTTSPPAAEAAAPTTQPPISITVEPTGVVVPVIALDNIFRPEQTVVQVGDEVLWENRGQNDHNVLYIEGDDWGVEVEGFAPGDTYSHVFTEPGVYAYFCSIHGTETFGMIGTITVEA